MSFKTLQPKAESLQHTILPKKRIVDCLERSDFDVKEKASD
jgi:hypothetical protein